MKNIALAFSGGGFRAAVFSLGTLFYLNKVECDGEPLLNNVKFIGSTSGGSITNLVYASGICQGKDFNKIYEQLLDVFEGDKLIAKVFKILADDKFWNQRPDKSRNLINAFSIAYDDMGFLDGQTMAVFSEKLADSHLDEITVNATEFSNGISFRFQTRQQGTGFPKGRVGNNYIYFKESMLDVADKLKLADMLACSSCFPGGFEPFIFPIDFSHSNLSSGELSAAISYKTNPFTVPGDANDPLEDKRFKELENAFGLMDGGIADNQAIDSVLLANKRRLKGDIPVFDLIIATDVTSYFMDSYTLPVSPKNHNDGISLRSIKNILLLVGLIFPVLVFVYFSPAWRSWMYLLVFFTLCSAIIWLWIESIIANTKKKAENSKSTWLIILLKYGGYFTKLGINVLIKMLLARLKSVFMLTEDIYLKQIRRHYYNMVYNDPALASIFISNAIYDLSTVKQKSVQDGEMKKVIGFNSLTDMDTSVIPMPSEKLIAVAETARLMPTTLWFDQYHVQDHMLKTVIATGQFTTCYNLLKYIVKQEAISSLKPDVSSIISVECKSLKTELLADWTRFNEDPYFMVNETTGKVN